MIHAIAEYKYFRPVFYIVSALTFVFGMDFFFLSGSANAKESTINLFLFGAVLLLLRMADKITKGKRLFLYLYAGLFSFALILGKIMYEDSRINPLLDSGRVLIASLIAMFGFTVVFGKVCELFVDVLCRRESVLSGNKKGLWKIFRLPHMYLWLWGTIFVTWIPCFLAYYPGIFSYDIGDQALQAAGVTEYSKFHPPLHTAIWHLCLIISGIIGVETIIVYELIQMAFLSAVFARLVHFLIQKKLNNWIILSVFLFVSVNPVVAVCSLVPAKDIWFAAFFVLTSIDLCKLIADPDRFLHSIKDCVRLAVCLTIACLFRNNAIYVYILCTPIAFLIFKGNRKLVLAVFAAGIAGYFLIHGFVYDSLGIAPGKAREMLSVPMQQISNVVVNEGENLPKKTRKRINEFIPYKKITRKYNPRWADTIKIMFNNDAFNEDGGKFIGLWFDLLKEYPVDYVNAFLTLNIPYWYPDASSVDPISGRQYIETNIAQCRAYTYERESKLPFLYNFYEKIVRYNGFRSVPVVSVLYSLATPVWSALFGVAVLLARKKGKLAFLFAPSLFLWLTYMAGPVSNFRYIFPIFMIYPLFLAAIMCPGALLTHKDV